MQFTDTPTNQTRFIYSFISLPIRCVWGRSLVGRT
uniref:Uncharacterized protein n=1 Tax=Anguilla anguilla TaxID=7936 RepID=A0A0E9RDZ3_ANGAN